MSKKNIIKVNILGTEYEVLKLNELECPKLKDAAGLCENYSKQLIINSNMQNEETHDNFEEFEKEVLRHELIHAFFYESGMREKYGTDELIVDWIATQSSKIFKIMKELDII